MSISRRDFVRKAAGAAALGLGSGLTAWSQTAPQGQPTPATNPARPIPKTQRKPEQVELLKKLLQEQETPPPILPQKPAPATGSGTVESPPLADAAGLLVEGTSVFERPGRLVMTGDRAEFVFIDPNGRGPQTLELLKNQFLEILERDAETGVTQFVISGEITRYRGKNYLLLRKVLRRVPNENLAP